jgi:uncharacterized protein (DUF697 family)
MARLHPFTIFSLVRELRLAAESNGPLCVDGAPALAEALGKELARDSGPSAVRVGLTGDAEALVYVLAHPPTEEDERKLAAARRAKVPIVAVLAGPELEPRVPNVLATDVVRVAAGEGFPIDEIGRSLAGRLGEGGTSLAARVPALREAVCRELIEKFARRAAIVGVAVWVPGADMAAITLGQIRLVLRIGVAHGVAIDAERVPEVLAVIASGFAFRAVARGLLGFVPVAGWAIKAGVAYAGTKALGEAALVYFGQRAPA